MRGNRPFTNPNVGCRGTGSGRRGIPAAADEGGDTLDTSTPAPGGNGSGLGNRSWPSRIPAPVDSILVEPSVGGFIIPIDGDVFYEPELRVLASLPGTPPSSMVLLVDGYAETNPLSIADGLVTARLTGSTIRSASIDPVAVQ